MKWTAEAENAVKKVPFFVRKKVRAKVEAHAQGRGKAAVDIGDVKAAKDRYMKNMDAEIMGFRLDACFGADGCLNRACDSRQLMQQLEALLEGQNLMDFLKQQVNGPLKFHHEFRVTLADCPNACSQPQIKDIGIIGAAPPVVTDAECSLCGECEQSCKEKAVLLDAEQQLPVIDYDRCVNCDQCARACPTGTIATHTTGYQVLLGGKLGRHPRLAQPLPGLYDAETVVAIVKWCVHEYKNRSRGGRRFAEIAAEDGDFMVDRLLHDLNLKLNNF
ncbi:MAG: 4Fe-4S binding protein [Thermodesulfobacteriota bacterium]